MTAILALGPYEFGATCYFIYSISYPENQPLHL